MVESQLPNSTIRFWDAMCCNRYGQSSDTSLLRHKMRSSEITYTLASGMYKDGSQCASKFSTPFTAIGPFMTVVPYTNIYTTLSTTGFRVFTYYDYTAVFRTTSHAQEGTINQNIGFDTTVTYKNVTMLSFGTMVAEAVRIHWQSTDLTKFPPAYATSIASLMRVPFNHANATTSLASSATSLPSPGSSSAISKPTTHPTPNSALSTGGKAGIGVGIVVGATLVAFALIVWHLRRRRKRLVLQIPALPEMEGYEKSIFKRFLAGKWRAEAEAESKPVEIGSSIPPVELDGTNVIYQADSAESALNRI